MIIRLNITDSWNDLSQWQIKSLASLIYSGIRGIAFDYKVLLILGNIRWWKFRKRWKVEKILKQSTTEGLREAYPWVYSKLGLTTFIPTIKTRSGKELSAPADRINNLTINEFAFADDCFLGFHSTKSLEYLWYLAAILYREKDSDGHRIPFREDELDVRATDCEKIDHKTLFSVLLSYNGCREYLMDQFKVVFPKPKDQEKKGKRKIPKSSGFGNVILHLSGGKFGTHTETKNTNVYTFLSEYQNLFIKSKDA